MKLELNLVETRNAYGNLFNLLARKRVLVDSSDESGTLTECFEFLKENLNDLELVGVNATTLQLIQNSESATVTDLFCVKYILATSGIDLLFYSVDESYVANQSGLSDGQHEYLILNENDKQAGFVPSVLKRVVSDETLVRASLYLDVVQQFDLFNSKVIPKDVILRPSVDSLVSQEEMMGNLSEGTVSYVDLMLDYLGFKIQVILP